LVLVRSPSVCSPRRHGCFCKACRKNAKRQSRFLNNNVIMSVVDLFRQATNSIALKIFTRSCSIACARFPAVESGFDAGWTRSVYKPSFFRADRDRRLIRSAPPRMSKRIARTISSQRRIIFPPRIRCRGREFTEPNDSRGSGELPTRLVIINERWWNNWPGKDPIGRAAQGE